MPITNIEAAIAVILVKAWIVAVIATAIVLAISYFA